MVLIFPIISHITATGDLIKSLRGKQISSSQARELAKSFQLMSAVELGDPPSTDLGALCDLWREKSADATPEGLVESLMCCKGLGKYASGMGRELTMHAYLDSHENES